METISASQLDNLSIEPTENQDQLPCSISGFFPALSGGAIGFVFGAGGAAFGRIMNRKAAAAAKASGNHVGFFKHSWQEGAKSAKTFAIMSGVYSTASCIAKRLRQRDDAVNGAVAGCATGLVLGWGGGPASAAQSCAMIGIFSYIVDRLGAAEAQATQLWQQQQQRQRGARPRPGQGFQAGQAGVVVHAQGRTREEVEGPCADALPVGGRRVGCVVRRSSRGSGGAGAGAEEGEAPGGRWGPDWEECEEGGGVRDVPALLQHSAAAFLTPAARWLRPCAADEGACWMGPRKQRR